MVTVRYCPTCGVDRREGDRFCRRCGTELGSGQTSLHTAPTASAPAAFPEAPVPPPQASGVPPAYVVVPAAPAPPAAPGSAMPQVATGPAGAPAIRPRPVALLGALVVAVSALLPWVTLVVSTSAFEIDVAFLFGSELKGSGVPVGALLLPVAATAAGLALRGAGSIVRRLLGAGALAIAALFVMAVFDAVSDAGGGGAMDLIGLGPFVTGAGALGLLVSR